MSKSVRVVMLEGGFSSHGYFSLGPVDLWIVLHQPAVPQDYIVLEIEDIEDLAFQSVLYS